MPLGGKILGQILSATNRVHAETSVEASTSVNCLFFLNISNKNNYF